MKHRVVTVLFAAGLLGGCSSSFLDNALEYPSTNGQKNEPAASNETSGVPAPSPTTVAAARTTPFVVVPEAPPLGSTGETHQSLRAGTAPPTPVAVQPKVAEVPLRDIAIAPAARTAIVTPAPSVAQIAAPPPAPPVARPSAPPPVARTAMIAPPPPVAREVAPPPVAPAPVRRTVTAPPAPPVVRAAPAPVAVASVPPARTVAPPAQPTYTAPPPPAAQPSYVAPAAPVAQPAPTAVAQASVAQAGDMSAGDSWCVRVAKSAQDEAAEQGFDAATQQRRALAMFKQCSANAH